MEERMKKTQKSQAIQKAAIFIGIKNKNSSFLPRFLVIQEMRKAKNNIFCFQEIERKK